MAAPARTAPVLPATRPARRARPRRRPGTRPQRQNSGLRLIGRSAQAVGHFPESGLVRTAAAGRRWIAVVGALLLMIVAINVITVSYGATASKLETQIEAIQRQSAILESSRTAALSTPRVRRQAVAAGMVLPEPDAISYRSFHRSDFAAAAARLAAGG